MLRGLRVEALAARELARIDLDNTVVRAPVRGVVGNRQAFGLLVERETAPNGLVRSGDVLAANPGTDEQPLAHAPGILEEERPRGRVLLIQLEKPHLVP